MLSLNNYNIEGVYLAILTEPLIQATVQSQINKWKWPELYTEYSKRVIAFV